jgi:hypothetical protein
LLAHAPIDNADADTAATKKRRRNPIFPALLAIASVRSSPTRSRRDRLYHGSPERLQGERADPPPRSWTVTTKAFLTPAIYA